MIRLTHTYFEKGCEVVTFFEFFRVVSDWFRIGFGLVSEWFQSGFGVVSEWFRSGFGVVSECFQSGFGVDRSGL